MRTLSFLALLLLAPAVSFGAEVEVVVIGEEESRPKPKRCAGVKRPIEREYKRAGALTPLTLLECSGNLVFTEAVTIDKPHCSAAYFWRNAGDPVAKGPTFRACDYDNATESDAAAYYDAQPADERMICEFVMKSFGASGGVTFKKGHALEIRGINVYATPTEKQIKAKKEDPEKNYFAPWIYINIKNDDAVDAVLCYFHPDFAAKEKAEDWSLYFYVRRLEAAFGETKWGHVLEAQLPEPAAAKPAPIRRFNQAIEGFLEKAEEFNESQKQKSP